MARSNGQTNRNTDDREQSVSVPSITLDYHDVKPGTLRTERAERGGRTVNVQKLSGDREEIGIGELVPERATPKLRSFIDTLRDRGILTEEQCDYFDATLNRLETILPQQANLKEGPGKAVWQDLVDANPYRGDPSQLIEAGVLEAKIASAYKAQLLSTAAVLEGFDHANTNDIQKVALLAYANYLVNRIDGDVSLDTLNRQLVGVGIDTSVLVPMQQAFGRLGLDVGVTFDDFALSMLRHDNATMYDGHLVADRVDGYLNERAVKCYRDLGGFVKAVDDLATEQEIADRARHSRSELLGVSRENPFRDWEAMARGSNNGQLKCIDGLLGEDKYQRGILGIPVQADINHHSIETYDLYGPVKQANGGETREKFIGAQFAFFCWAYGGEVQRGGFLKKGEVVKDKKFFSELIKLNTHVMTIDSADKAANAMMQIQAARVVELENHLNPTNPGNFLADMTHEEISQAEAFMMPMLDLSGKPTFLVIRKADMFKMYECAKKSQESFAKYAPMDKRYTEKPWAERAQEFDMPQKSFETTYSNWVDELRDAGKVKDVAGEVVRKLHTERSSQASIYEAAQIDDALDNYMEQFARFESNYCRLENYRQEAAERLVSRGFTNDNGRGWSEALDREVKAVALEYMYKAQAYKNLTAKVLGMRDGRQLRALLTNIDYELEITTMAMATTISEKQLRTAARPFLRSREGYKYSGADIQQDFEAAQDAYATIHRELEQSHVSASDYKSIARLGYIDDPLMLRLNALARPRVSTIVSSGVDTVPPTEESTAARNAERLAALMATLGSHSRGGFANTYMCTENAVFVSKVDGVTALSRELVGIDSRDGAQYGRAEEDFHRTFKRTPTEEERQRYMQEDVEVVRARKAQISKINMVTGVHQALSAEVASLVGSSIQMDDEKFLVFVSRLYPVLKGLSNAGSKYGLEGLLGLGIMNARDPKRRSVIRADEVKDAVSKAFNEAREEARLEESVTTVAPEPEAEVPGTPTLVRSPGPVNGSVGRIPQAKKPGAARP